MSILFLSLRKLLWDSSCSVQLNSNQNIQIKIFKSKYPTGLSEFAHKVWATPSSPIYSWLYPQGWPLSSESRGIGKMFLFFMQVFKERLEGPYTYENFALFPPEIWKCHHSAFSGTVWIQEGKWQPINFFVIVFGPHLAYGSVLYGSVFRNCSWQAEWIILDAGQSKLGQPVQGKCFPSCAIINLALVQVF